MRASFICVTAACAFLGCGGKVIFDTGSSTGGANNGTTSGSTTYAMTTHGTAVGGTTHAVTSTVGSTTYAVATTVGVTTSVTTGTGMGCVDPGPPMGAMVGNGDCGMMSCQASTCAEACSALYDCGLAKCGPGGAPLCQFANEPMFHDYFASPMGPCGQACMQQPIVKQLVDPTNCAATIQTLKNASPQFAQFCNQGGGGFGG